MAGIVTPLAIIASLASVGVGYLLFRRRAEKIETGTPHIASSASNSGLAQNVLANFSDSEYINNGVLVP